MDDDLETLFQLILEDMPRATNRDLAADGPVGDEEGQVWARIEKCAQVLREHYLPADEPVSGTLWGRTADEWKNIEARARIFEDNPGLKLIARERIRQIGEKRWSREHDDEHEDGELANAASCYAVTPSRRKPGVVPMNWPVLWSEQSWRPTPDDRVKELCKAGALIVAEIERLGRVPTPPPAPVVREDYETTTVEAAARFAEDQGERPRRISGQPVDPNEYPTPAEYE